MTNLHRDTIHRALGYTSTDKVLNIFIQILQACFALNQLSGSAIDERRPLLDSGAQQVVIVHSDTDVENAEGDDAQLDHQHQLSRANILHLVLERSLHQIKMLMLMLMLQLMLMLLLIDADALLDRNVPQLPQCNH